MIPLLHEIEFSEDPDRYWREAWFHFHHAGRQVLVETPTEENIRHPVGTFTILTYPIQRGRSGPIESWEDMDAITAQSVIHYLNNKYGLTDWPPGLDETESNL